MADGLKLLISMVNIKLSESQPHSNIYLHLFYLMLLNMITVYGAITIRSFNLTLNYYIQLRPVTISTESN